MFGPARSTEPLGGAVATERRVGTTETENAMNKDVHRYVDAVSRDRKALFHELHGLIMGLYPNAKVVMSYQVPTYRAKTGWVALGYWKNGVSLYTNGLHHIAEFKASYPAIKTGKGSINFKVSDAVPAAALKRVIRHAMEHPKEP
jgi:uncharacterized protein YdhG (YjbR/CyaY superfamily)